MTEDLHERGLEAAERALDAYFAELGDAPIEDRDVAQVVITAYHAAQQTEEES